MRMLPCFGRKSGYQMAGGNSDSGGGGGGYTLPIASPTTLGGIKVGNNLSIDGDGVLSASGGGSGGISFSSEEHEVGTFGNRKLFSKTLSADVSSSETSANAWIGNGATDYEDIIGYFGNFIDGHTINVAITRADYEANSGSWHVMGSAEYRNPSNGKVYLTIFYTKANQ